MRDGANTALNIAAGLLLLMSSVQSIAGPPMITDDTGTAEAGQWEYLLFARGERRESNNTSEFPGIEFVYGLSEKMDFGLSIPWQRSDGQPVFEPGADEEGERVVESGLGVMGVAWKWRFFDNGSAALAVAPELSIPLSDFSQIRGVVSDSYSFSVPLLGSIRRGRWVLVGSIGYTWISRDLNTMSASLLLGRELTKSVRLLGEAYFVETRHDLIEDDTRNWRVGIEISVNDRWQVIGAYGDDFSSSLAKEDQLEFDYYLGIRYLGAPSRD